MGTETGRAPVVVFQKTSPRFWQAQQPKRMASRGRIENDVVEPRHIAVQKSHEFVEGGYFSGASARKLLAHGRSLVRGSRRSELFQHTGSIALGCCLRVNVHCRKPGHVRHRRWAIGQGDFEHLVEV